VHGSAGQLVAGVDGCRGGWVVVTAAAAAGGPVWEVEVLAAVAPVIERLRRGELAAVAVDMPMGLPPAGPRASDGAARARLGARRSTVFPTPPRPLLHCATHAEAVARGRALDGRGLSIQAFNLLPRIAELDAAIDASLADRLVEGHPESGFAEMAGAPLTTSKRTADGRAERLTLLHEHLSADLEVLGGRHPGAASDDVLDAAANVWTARRWRAGAAVVLGDGRTDERGLPMRVVI
jgi:predicted RNase H-like nuclease